MKEWKVGDKFIIIDARLDSLDPRMSGRVYEVAKLTPDKADNGFLTEKGYENRVWFRPNSNKDVKCCYVSKKNIRTATKLERALK